MPILVRDPWREQYFEAVPCPAACVVAIDDIDCWPMYPQHRWVYDRLKIAETQGIVCGPHGIAPPSYPVFSKPIVNLQGMGLGSAVLHSPGDMAKHHAPGHFWMELLHGDHVSTDVAVEFGRAVWIRHATGEKAAAGMFNYWTVHAEENAQLRSVLNRWIAHHLPDYSGLLNIETIGGKIIEMHLRFADQWCDLYGSSWIEAVVGLYAHGSWTFNDAARMNGYSIPLFAAHGQELRHPPAALQAAIRAMPGVSSLQITFFDDHRRQQQAMPPGGFRIALVNCTDLATGLAARRMLATAYPETDFLIAE